MFIRIKSTKNSPRKSVQICESFRVGAKVRQKIIRHVGVAQDEANLQELKALAEYLMQQLDIERRGPDLFNILPKSSPPKPAPEEAASPPSQPTLSVDLVNIKEESRLVEGFHDIFGKLFRELGFHQLLSKRPTQILLDTLIARIAHPSSKRSSQEFLEVAFGRKTSLDSIYNMMDLLLPHADAILKNICHSTYSLFKEQANILLFDVTTLYFESILQDELRDFGYSKDQKFHMTQVVLALATNTEGFPIGYKIFPGNTAEVRTLLQCLNSWTVTLPIKNIVLVADRAMMSEKNLQALEDPNLNVNYVIATKLKKLQKEIKEKILANKGAWIELNKEKHCKQEIILAGNRRLIVTYSEKRAKKDREDRERMLEKMLQRLGKSKNPKKLITNHGYAKFIQADGKVQLSLNEEKIAEEAAWDGFHGIITNDFSSTAEELLMRYRRLWTIEECFRIQKDELAMRPIFHWKPERIKAHILLCYMAFTLIRHAEWRVQVQQRSISMRDISKELWRVHASILQDNETKKRYRMPSSMSNKAKKIYQAMGVVRDSSPREKM